MQQYLQQTQANMNQNSASQFQIFNNVGANGQGYPMIAQNS